MNSLHIFLWLGAAVAFSAHHGAAVQTPHQNVMFQVLEEKGHDSGTLLVLETSMAMSGRRLGWDRRTLLTVRWPSNEVIRRLPLVSDSTFSKLQRSGDWELVRAMENRRLNKALLGAEAAGYTPVSRRKNLRVGLPARCLSWPWGPHRTQLRISPGTKTSKLEFYRFDRRAHHTMATLPAFRSAASDGNTNDNNDKGGTLPIDTLFEVSLIGHGTLLAAVTGTWFREGSRVQGGERLVLLPLKKIARKWKLPFPLNNIGDTEGWRRCTN